MTPTLPRSGPRLIVAVQDHLAWAARVARSVSREYRLGYRSQEHSDLVQVACLALVRLAPVYDGSPEPDRVEEAFRGWAWKEVRKECRREAKRLANGGTYRTRNESRKLADGSTAPARPVVVEYLGDRRLADGSPMELPDSRSTVAEMALAVAHANA